MPPNQPTGMLNPAADPILTTPEEPVRAPPADPKAGMLSDWYSSYMGSPPKVAQAATAEWKPGADATVQGQLTKVLDAGGPLQDRAATKAAQTMNARGLLNSSMAVTAGQSALYDAAMPIATQDAATFGAAGQFNAGQANDVSKFNAGAVNTATGAQDKAGVDSFQQQQGIAGQKDLQATDIAQQTAMQERDLASRYDLANMDVQSRASLQAADIQNQKDLQALNAQLQTGLQATDNAVKQSMQAYDAALKQTMQGLDNTAKLELAKLDITARTSLAELDNKFRVQLQGSQSMASSYQSMVDGITRVMVDPSMDTAAKQAAINNLTTLYNNTLTMQSDLTGLDLGELLSPDVLEPVPGSAGTQPGGEPAPYRGSDGMPYRGGDRGNGNGAGYGLDGTEIVSGG